MATKKKVAEVVNTVVKAPINFMGYDNFAKTILRCDLSGTDVFGKIASIRPVGTKYEMYLVDNRPELLGKEVEFSYSGEVGGILQDVKFLKFTDEVA